MTLPRMDSVWALYALQKSMMLTPCGPRAVPTGGAGVAAPACSWTFTSAAIFFLGGIDSSLSLCGHDGGYPCHLVLLPVIVRLRTVEPKIAGVWSADLFAASLRRRSDPLDLA